MRTWRLLGALLLLLSAAGGSSISRAERWVSDQGLVCGLNYWVKTWATLLSLLEMNCMLGQRGAASRLSVPELTQFSPLPLTILLFLYDYIFKSSRASSRQGLEKSRRLLCLLCYCKYSGRLYNSEHAALGNARAVFTASSLAPCAAMSYREHRKTTNKICFSAENVCVESSRLPWQTEDKLFLRRKGIWWNSAWVLGAPAWAATECNCSWV